MPDKGTDGRRSWRHRSTVRDGDQEQRQTRKDKGQDVRTRSQEAQEGRRWAWRVFGTLTKESGLPGHP